MAAVLDSTILETEERGPSSRRGAIKATSFQFQYFMLWLDVNTASNVPTISRAYQHVNHSFAVQLFFYPEGFRSSAKWNNHNNPTFKNTYMFPPITSPFD